MDFGRLRSEWDSCACVVRETGSLFGSYVTPGRMIRMFGCASGENEAFLGGQQQGFVQGNSKGASHALLSAVSAGTYDWVFGVSERSLAR